MTWLPSLPILRHGRMARYAKSIASSGYDDRGDRLAAPADDWHQGKPPIGQRVNQSTATTTAMTNDLIEYARTQLNSQIPMTHALVDVKGICQAAISDANSAHLDVPVSL